MRLVFTLSCLLASLCSFGQSVTDAPLRWRCIGPFRAGRTVGASGVVQQPGTFYIGVNNGGVWKTTDYGRVWTPVFDDQPTGSIGDVAVAPGDPNVVYVASGEGIQRPDLSVGNGVYRSGDGGKTWTHTGLSDGQQIAGLTIDPVNADRVFVAVLGHPYGPNSERGVFRTLNGGKTWEKVKYIDENTGAAQVAIDPKNPDIVYADFWANRLAPWENGTFRGPGSGLWKSTDGGNTWRQLQGGLPGIEQNLGRIGFCICPSLPSRLYATVDCGEDSNNARLYSGIYRSDDAGEHWYRIATDGRLWGRGDDFAEIKADPKNPDIVYSANVVTWKSTDGAKTWEAWRGAPGGDDYHRLWINPDNPDVILVASDQGAIITVNGGKTFSSWYNQPTAQFYHVSTDNAFPYNVYGGQQESGSVCISSRGNDGAVTFRDWHPVGADEYGYVAPDPLDPNIIYGGRVEKYDKRTGQTQDVSPQGTPGAEYRVIRTEPLLFSPVDPHILYCAGSRLFKTRSGGHSWEVISPDLSRETWSVPACVGIYTPAAEKSKRRRGVIYAVAPSQQDTLTIWAGTDDGLMYLTRDGGKNWQNITPPSLTDWSKVSQLDAGHFDNNTCYAAINRIRLDDLRPHILRTHDGGKTWQEITRGIPENEPVNTVREDPKQKGLLFAGTENAVYVSFDDGDHWQSLRLRMPATSIRDLVIKDDDVVVGTHGRSFWILDNITSLRQLADMKSMPDVLLYQPQTAWRVRWNNYTDTPMPQEEPVGENPPDGAMMEYVLQQDAAHIKLEILDASGKNLIAVYNPDDPLPDVSGVNIPLYWIRPFQELSGTKGAHRFLWDLHYHLPDYFTGASYPIGAVYGQTAPSPATPWVMPGQYLVRLHVDGKTFERTFEVRLDPRVKTSLNDLQTQHDLSMQCVDQQRFMQKLVKDFRQNIALLPSAYPHPAGVLQDTLQHMQAGMKDLLEKTRQLQGAFGWLFNRLQGSDVPPATQIISSLAKAKGEADKLKEEQNRFLKQYQTWIDPAISRIKRGLEAAGKPFPDKLAKNDRKAVQPPWNPLFSADLSDAEFKPGVWALSPSGELTATEDQCIFTKKTYRNFALELEFKTADGTNSGIIVHCSDAANWIPNSVEIQIADDYSEEWSKAPATWQCGAVFGHLAAGKHAVKRPGEWNQCRILCIDRRIWVVLNGELVNYMDMSRWLSGAVNPDGSEIPSWLPRPFATLPLEGKIGFQGKHAGAPIWFRNIRVQEL